MFQGRLKATGEAIAKHKEVTVGIIILADYQVFMLSEACRGSGEENEV